MRSRRAVLAAFLLQTLVTAALIVGHGPWVGDVIWTFGYGRGLNDGDLIPLFLWAVGAGLCIWRLSDRS